MRERLLQGYLVQQAMFTPDGCILAKFPDGIWIRLNFSTGFPGITS